MNGSLNSKSNWFYALVSDRQIVEFEDAAWSNKIYWIIATELKKIWSNESKQSTIKNEKHELRI